MNYVALKRFFRNIILVMFNRDMRAIEQQRDKKLKASKSRYRVQGSYRNYCLKEFHTRLCLQANVYDKCEMIDLATKLFKMGIAPPISHISDPNHIFALQQY